MGPSALLLTALRARPRDLGLGALSYLPMRADEG